MSLLKSCGPVLTFIVIMCLFTAVYGYREHNRRLTTELDAANAIIRQLQQSQELSESASQKYSERKEALKNETARQQQIANDALESSKDWAGEFLPASVLRLLGNETADADTLPATDGAAR